ncbi:porin [Burkholderia cenocepacia]|nr:porin [Burkholderia cenocepacia]
MFRNLQARHAVGVGALAFGPVICASAHAQSSVTLYGIISESLQYLNNVGGHNQYGLASGTMQLPRWGLLGREDLGGGNTAIFRLENGFNATNGTLSQGGRIFGRFAYVGVESQRLGTATLGRQLDEMSTQVSFSLAATIFGSIGAHIGDNDNMFLTVRINNSVRYQSPSWRGWSFAGQYGFSNASSFAQNRAFSAGSTYQNGPLKVAAGFTQMTQPASTINPNGAVDTSNYGFSSPFIKSQRGAATLVQRIAGIGGTYDFNVVQINANYTNVLFDYVDGSGLRMQNAELGVARRITPQLLVGAAYIYSWGRYSGGSEPRWHQLDLGVDYALSKRTDLYLASIFQRAAGDAKFAQIYNNPASTSRAQTALEAGIRLRF